MFEYNEGTIKENQIRISPSGINDLIGHFPYWFKSRVLKQPYEYGKPDARVRGTILHALIESYYGKHTEDYVMSQVPEYLEKMGITDSWQMMNDIDLMFNAWKEEFGSKHKPDSMEQWLEFEPNDRIIISGTYDALFGDTVTDWKTGSKKKSNIDSYKNQLYLYTWLLRKQGKEVNNIQVCFIQTPLKSGAVNIVVMKEPIDEDYMTSLISSIQVCSKNAVKAMDNQDIKEFLSSIPAKSPYDRSY